MSPADTALVPARGRDTGNRLATIAPRDMPSPIEKAAIILTAIGPELAASFLRDLAPSDMQRFARALGGLGRIRQEVLDAVIVEFLEALTLGPEISGGGKAARALLGSVMSESDVARLLDRQTPAVTEDRPVWERMNETPIPALATFLAAEHPQTAAVILSEIRPETAASILERLDRGFAQSVVLRLARVPSLDGPIAAAIHGAIEREFLSVLQQNLSKRRPADLIAGLMNNISSEARDGFIGYLEAQEPTLAQDVQRTMFTFEDIPTRVSGRDIPTVLREVAEEDVLKGLKLGQAPEQPHGRLHPRERPAPPVGPLYRGACRTRRRAAQDRRGRADRDHQGDPRPGQVRPDPSDRKGRLRLSAVAAGSRIASRRSPV